MIEAWVGEEDFRRGVNAYLERYQYANARAEDFWGTIAKTTGKPVDRVMQAFVDQPGVPLVTAELKCGGQGQRAEVILSQERYVRDAAAPSAPQVWQIPVCLRGSSGQIVCDLLEGPRETVALDECPSWILGNAGARGYYRTASSPELVRRLADYVAPLAAAERMALISDEWALARAAKHDIGVFMDLAGGFRAERNEEVLQTLTRSLATIAEDIASPAALPKLRAWVSALLSPVLKDVGWVPQAQEPDARRSLRATVVAALGDTARDKQVLARARQLVEQDLDKPGSVDPTLLQVVVRLAAIEGDAALYDRYLARAKAAGDPETKYRYLYGLASFGNPALVRRTMDLILGPDVRSQDAKVFLAILIGAPEARSLAWELTRQRWDELQKKSGESGGNSLVVNALSSFCDTRAAGEIRSFFATHKVPDAERTLQQALERVESCARFVAIQRPKLDDWLRKRG